MMRQSIDILLILICNIRILSLNALSSASFASNKEKPFFPLCSSSSLSRNSHSTRLIRTRLWRTHLEFYNQINSAIFFPLKLQRADDGGSEWIREKDLFKDDYDDLDFDADSVVDFEDDESYRKFFDENSNGYNYGTKDYFDRDDDYFDDQVNNNIMSWEWEMYQKTTQIYLPPPPSDVLSTPETIIHFIGGTLFGSYPIRFYQTILESIAKKSNSIIIATSIPVTFQSNPLDHDRLCFNIVKSFRDAYRNVICDEYGTKVANTMKIVGLGHSLGSRLHCIISSNSSLLKIGYQREGNVLISFNNFNAMSSVPGVKSLKKNVREAKMKDKVRQNRDQKVAWDDDYINDFSQRRRGRKSSKTKDYYSLNNRYYFDEDDEDVDFQEVVEAVKDGIENRLSSIRATLTPDLKQEAFEFQPTPEELWCQIEDGVYSKNVPKNLVVQFDGDEIDQSVRLARSIAGGKCKDNEVDVKFARLRGTHLTPVSYVGRFGVGDIVKRISTYPIDDILKEAVGEETLSQKRLKKKASTRKNMKDLNNLVDSVVEYILQLSSSS